MQKIDSEKLANETSTCGKRLKVCVIAGLYADTILTLEKKNPILKEVKEKCGDDLFAQMENTIISFFALNLLAKTHNKKEFEEIFAKVQIEDDDEA